MTTVTSNELTPEQVRDSKIYTQWGLTEAEYDLIVAEIKRLPNYTETGIFSGMWSEHVSYKKSKPILRKFWSTNERVLQGPGEGAGILDIGDGQAVVFKAESHNHPSSLNLMKVRQLVLVAFCVIFSQWVRNPLLCLIHSVLEN